MHQAHCDDESAQPPSKRRKLTPFPKPRQEAYHTAIYWPRDLVRHTVPKARVLTYGYDIHTRHELGPVVNGNILYDIAWNLLVALEAGRWVEPSRPVLFVAHGLGGIVVKEMLRRSSDCHRRQPHLRSVFESTVGIMFFGTAHDGTDPRNPLQDIAEKAIKAAGFSVNEQVVKTLLPSTEHLRELRAEFGAIAHERNLILHSFQEQLGVTLLGDYKASGLISPATLLIRSAGRRGYIILSEPPEY